MFHQVSGPIRRSATTLCRRIGQQHKVVAPAAAVGARFLSNSPWADYEMAPLDPIIGLNEEYNRDDFPQKVIIGVGAYREIGRAHV